MLSLAAYFVADIIGLTKDDQHISQSVRTQFSESLAIQISVLITQKNTKQISPMLSSLTHIHKDIEGIALKKNNTVVVKQGNIDEQLINELSGDNRLIKIDLFRGSDKWGQLNVLYKPNPAFTLLGFELSQNVMFYLFMIVFSSIMFWLLLRNILRHLDPNNVVPERVRNALDILAEGVIVLDDKSRIVLANTNFVNKINTTTEKLIGRYIDDIPWSSYTLNQRDSNILPWVVARENLKTVAGEQICITMPNEDTKTFNINCSPILDEGKKFRGQLITFDDITELEMKNQQLKKTLTLLNTTQEELQNTNKELKDLASKDPLTGCLNRRAFFDAHEEMFLQMKEKEILSLYCIMFDIDHFKRINDTFGHQAGDEAIKTIANTLHKTLRKPDSICRYGGEEFCILIKNTTLDNCYASAERLRKKIESIKFNENSPLKDHKITCSMGISELNPKILTLSDLIDHADKALYVAKENGRNQVIVWNESFTKENSKPRPTIIKSNRQERSTYEETDHITNLASRTSFIDRIEDALQDNRSQFAIILIDLNIFKRINSLLGYSTGDLVLEEVGKRICFTLRDSDVVAYLKDKQPNQKDVARLNGDEFGIILPDIEDQSVLQHVINRLINNITEPYSINGHEFEISFSVGYCLAPEDGHSVEILLKNAEHALMNSKRQGSNQFVRFNHTLMSDRDEYYKLSLNLNSAIRNDEIYLVYQPKLDIRTGKFTGVEALARWQHPTLGNISPMDFIPIAEENGKIFEIGQMVIRKACRQLKQWHDHGFLDFCVSINLSIKQFDAPDLFQQIVSILKAEDVEPQYIEFEITESKLIENFDKVVSVIDQFRSYGIKISIDDFGVGYSSLTYLKKMPIDCLKIDKIFIDHITQHETDEAIIAAITTMAKVIGLKVVAEGIEQEDQLALLTHHDCHEIQGNLISKPISGDDITNLLTSNKKAIHNANSAYLSKKD